VAAVVAVVCGAAAVLVAAVGVRVFICKILAAALVVTRVTSRMRHITSRSNNNNNSINVKDSVGNKDSVNSSNVSSRASAVAAAATPVSQSALVVPIRAYMRTTWKTMHACWQVTALAAAV
jgi:hypothetical protein